MTQPDPYQPYGQQPADPYQQGGYQQGGYQQNPYQQNPYQADPYQQGGYQQPGYGAHQQPDPYGGHGHQGYGRPGYGQQPGYGYPPPPPPPRRGMSSGAKIGLAVGGVALVALVFGGIAVIGTIASNDRDRGDTPVAAPVVSPGQSNPYVPTAPTGDPLASLGGEDVDVSGAAGDTLEGNGVSVTATELTAGDSTFGSTVCTTVTYVNGSDENTSYNTFDWSLQDSAGVIETGSFFGSDDQLSAGDLAPGGQVSGDVCFDEPAAGGQVTIIFEPLVIFNDDRRTWSASI